ncbi:MAG: DUF4337 domain-containing protein [Massilia sp.]
MELDPRDTVEQAQHSQEPVSTSSRLNVLVAISVALLATFMGICKVKDDNIVQAMQQAQANKIDHWAFYQARNIRQEIMKSTELQMELAMAAAPESSQATYRSAIEKYTALEAEQESKKEELMAQAAQDQKEYDANNYRDDQFDLSDAFLAITVALLAVTALTQQRWLFGVAMVPTFFGILMGLSGLLSWQVHPDWLIKLIT